MGYGFGFLWAWWVRIVLKRGDENTQAFKKNFYK
jgi:hypothetical protein